MPGEFSFAVMRRYPRINRAGCPSSVLSCTAWGFSCLANCSASGELLPRLFTLACLRNGKLSASPTSQRTGGMFSVTLSVNARPAAAGRMLPAYFTRHAAVWCSDFPPANPANAGLTSDHLPSERSISQSGKQENRSRRDGQSRPIFLSSPIADSKRRGHMHQKN
jgi:hypothetical protein